MKEGTTCITNAEGFSICTDKSILQIDVIHHFLSKESYWAQDIDYELVEAAVENSSVCYGIYEGDINSDHYRQIGFARVISDFVRFAWLSDVFVLPEYRGRGLSKWLMSVIVNNPKLKGTNFNLVTEDAQTLYAQFGFKPLENIERRLARPIDWEEIYRGHNLVKQVK